MPSWYLIHGAASTRLTWTRQMPVLSSAIRAELPALSDIRPENLIDAWADWCLGDLKEPAYVMGHSLGGAIAQTMALRAPHMVRGLVLVGTGPRLPVNPSLIESLQRSPEEALQQITRWSLARTPNPELLAKSLEMIRSIDPHRTVREYLACTFFDVKNQLHRIQGPKALVGATEDRMTPLTLMEEFQSAWPNASLHVISHAGHMMMLEQPDQFNQILVQLNQDFQELS